MIGAFRPSRPVALAAAYLLAVYAALAASALGAHAGRAAGFEAMAARCLGGDAAPSDSDRHCADLCRFAAAPALVVDGPSDAVSPVARPFDAGTGVSGRTVAQNAPRPSARGPPAVAA